MMKKYGFTLIELLGVFTLLGLILMISIPSLIGLLKKQKETTYQTFLNELYLAAETYANTTDRYDFSLPNQKIYVKLEDLVKSNYLKSTRVDPKTDEKINLEHYIEIIVNSDNSLHYNYMEEVPEINLIQPVYLVNPTTYTNQEVKVQISYGAEGGKLFKTTVPVVSNQYAVSCGRIYKGICNGEVTNQIIPNEWYKVEQNVILTFQENGIVTAQSVEGLNYNSSSSMTINNIDKENPTIDLVKTGTILFTDANFSNGLNGLKVYNNSASYDDSSNATIELTRETMDTPVGNYAVKISSRGSFGVFPYSGGFMQTVDVFANATYIHKIIAKIPEGHIINSYTNDIGDNPQMTWLTDRNGTGEWEEYIYMVETSGTGKFNNMGFITVSNQEGYGSEVTWYVASSQVIDATTSGTTLFVYTKDDNKLASYGCNQSSTTSPTYTSLKGKSHSAICSLGKTGDYYLWLKDEAGNEIIELVGTGYLGNALHKDFTFTNGLNNVEVYDNKQSGLITIERNVNISTSTPFSRSYSLTINKSAGVTSPMSGGYTQRTQSEANHTYIHRIIAKIPVGYSILNSNNALGDNPKFTWLTSNTGTSEWEEYIYQLETSGTGTFSTFGFVYLQPLPESGIVSTQAVSWDLAYSTVIDVVASGSTYTFIVKK